MNSKIKIFLTGCLFTLIFFCCSSCSKDQIVEPQILNYFPLNVGNYWRYSFRYKPISWDDEEYDGEMSWDVIEQKDDDFTILQKIDGIHITYNYTTNIKDTSLFNLEQVINLKNYDGFIEILKPNFFNRAFKFKYIYDGYEDYITIRNDFEYENMGNVISLDGEWDILGLRRNVGIEYWHIQASHNSGPYSEFFLDDYKIQ